ncbi:WYL domain-containing protein [Streptobacillus canis]|uniref:WYL domain-containing protein n=1 Tax=Streptobacillus canis TaxID=2678686 RepID=UPI0012E315F1|nr:WYL domain-containing protein [Streptobacillus canis]
MIEYEKSNRKVSFKVTNEEERNINSEIRLLDISYDKFFLILLNYYSSHKVKKELIKTTPIEELNKKSGKIQFNIDENLYNKIIEIVTKEHGYNSKNEKSMFFRDMCYTFFNESNSKRKEIIYGKIINKIKEAKTQNKKVNFIYNNENKSVTPIDIKEDKEKQHLYLLAYDENSEDNFINFRIDKILEVSQSLYPAVDLSKDESLIQVLSEIYLNYSPFLNFSNIKVIAKFTEKGKKILKDISVNRPYFNVEDLKNTTIKFNCSIKHAEIYFSQFYNEVEILEPIELRNIFKKKLKETLKLYEKTGEL